MKNQEILFVKFVYLSNRVNQLSHLPHILLCMCFACCKKSSAGLILMAALLS